MKTCVGRPKRVNMPGASGMASFRLLALLCATARAQITIGGGATNINLQTTPSLPGRGAAPPPPATGSLSAGDCMVVAFNTDSNVPNANKFAFVLLKDLPAGETISVTDDGWSSRYNTFNTMNAATNPGAQGGESHLSYVATQPVTASSSSACSLSSCPALSYKSASQHCLVSSSCFYACMRDPSRRARTPFSRAATRPRSRSSTCVRS